MKTRIVSCFACLLLLLHIDSAAEARFLKPDLVKIPVDRLIKNLEAAAQKEVKGFSARYNLARCHAMAYAVKSDFVEGVRKKSEKGTSEEPYYGPTPSIIPFK